MAHIDIREDGRIAIWSEFREKDYVKLVPGSKWDAEEKVWTVPLSWSSCKVLRGVFGQTLTVGEALVSWAQIHVDQYVNPCLEVRELTEWEGDERLYPFQRAGVEFIRRSRNLLLGDEMGSGKTIQAIMGLRCMMDTGCSVLPALVICPNSMKKTWEKEFAKWWPEVSVGRVSGSADKRRKVIESRPDVTIINWDAMRLHSRLAPYGSIKLADKEKVPGDLNKVPFKTIIGDEAHKLKNPQSKWTRASWAVAHQPSVEYRIPMTGTPLANAPDDLWAILHFMAPDEWPSKTKFVDRYCMVSWNAWGGMEVLGIKPETRDEFFAILDPHFRRMPKELVLPFLPPKLRSTRYTDMSTRQKKAYVEMENDMITKLDDGSVLVVTNNLTKNTRLTQFSSSYAHMELGTDGEMHVRLTEPSNKIDELMDVLDELGPSEGVVVAAESKQLIDLAAARLDAAQKEAFKNHRSPLPFSYRMIVGGQTDDERDRHMTDFQSGQARIMLMTIKAGGVGLTLTRAGVIVFLQRSWSMLENKQAEDRVHRIGSEVHDKVLVIDMVTPDTVEETQIERLYVKFQRLQEITRDKETLRAAGDLARLAELENEEARITASDLTQP